MAGSGPTPNPNSRRQTSGGAAGAWTDLPSEGFQGDVPMFPLPRPNDRELEVWASVWRTPQAVAWHRNGWTHDVGMYVRYLVKGESSLDHAKEARMWSDRLGLNPAAMLKNRWRVRESATADVSSIAAKKTHALKVVDDAVARPRV